MTAAQRKPITQPTVQAFRQPMSQDSPTPAMPDVERLENAVNRMAQLLEQLYAQQHEMLAQQKGLVASTLQCDASQRLVAEKITNIAAWISDTVSDLSSNGHPKISTPRGENSLIGGIGHNSKNRAGSTLSSDKAEKKEYIRQELSRIRQIVARTPIEKRLDKGFELTNSLVEMTPVDERWAVLARI